MTAREHFEIGDTVEWTYAPTGFTTPVGQVIGVIRGVGMDVVAIDVPSTGPRTRVEFVINGTEPAIRLVEAS